MLQLRMNSGGIRQKGGRVSEKDGKIGMCVVVHAAGVGRCQRDTKSGYRVCRIVSGSVGNCGYKIGVTCLTDTRAQRGLHARSCSSSLPFESINQPRINSRQQHNHPSSSFSLSPTSAPSISYSSHSTSQNFRSIFHHSPPPSLSANLQNVNALWSLGWRVNPA